MKGGEERGGVLGSAEREMERRGFKTKVMACCDKHRLKSLSRSDTAGTVHCTPLLSLPRNTELKTQIFYCRLE